MRQRQQIPVAIANGASLSSEINVGAHRIVGIQMPAAWTAANLTLQALVRTTAGSPPTLTFGDVYNTGGTELVLATNPAADRYIALDEGLPLVGLGRIKVRSGTTGVPVNQGAARDFFLVVEIE